MMKPLLSSFFATLIFGSALAQTSIEQQHNNMLNALLQAQAASPNSRTLSERVIAQSTWDNFMGSKSDSVKLLYPLNGTSLYDYNMMLYAYNYPYSTTPMFNYLGVFTKPQIQYQRYDHWTINPNTLTYGFYQRNLCEYDAYMNLTRDTALYADSAVYPNMRYVNGFTATGNVDTSHSYVWDSGVSTNAFKQFFSYNVSGKLVKDSTYEFDSGSWYKVAKTLYTYDVPGNLIQIDNYSNNSDSTFTLPLVEQLKYVNTYDASGRLKTVNSSFFNGTALLPYVIDSFAYSGTTAFHLSWKQYQYDPINMYWAPMTYMTKTLNGAGLPDVININTFDSLANAWVPYYKWMVTYNTSNDPVKKEEFIYNWTSFPATPDFTTYYYYESFTNTTGIANIPIPKANVFPNPGRDFLNVTGLNAKNCMVIITFTDHLGKMVSREKTYFMNGELKLSTGHMAAGTYILSIVDETGKPLLYQGVVISR